LQGEPVADLSATYHKIHSVHVSGETTVRAIDEIPIWCVLAAQADKISVLSDAQELRVKESDRLESMAENLKRLGVRVESKNDGLVIEGKQGGLEHPKYSGYGPGYLESYGDHRVAMALAIASLCIRQKKEGVEIHDTQCVATSFPEFFSLLKQIQ
jgi:3-phosphoshikimate 1-carboxyvinyltransferase